MVTVGRLFKDVTQSQQPVWTPNSIHPAVHPFFHLDAPPARMSKRERAEKRRTVFAKNGNHEEQIE